MIFTFVFTILAIILEGIAGLLGMIPVVLAQEIIDALAYFSGYLNYVGGIINIPGVLPPLFTLVGFIAAWYSFKLVMWAWHMIPGIGKKDEMHKFGGEKK